MARVSEILSNLNVRKPAGPDGITPKLLKIAAPVIAKPMTKLFDYCIDVGEWPCQWKLSNVTPVHKKDDETSKTKYRPISVLSVIPKVFEKLMVMVMVMVFIYRIRSIYIFKCGLHYFSTRVRSDISIYKRRWQPQSVHS